MSSGKSSKNSSGKNLKSSEKSSEKSTEKSKNLKKDLKSEEDDSDSKGHSLRRRRKRTVVGESGMPFLRKVVSNVFNWMHSFLHPEISLGR